MKNWVKSRSENKFYEKSREAIQGFVGCAQNKVDRHHNDLLVLVKVSQTCSDVGKM